MIAKHVTAKYLTWKAEGIGHTLCGQILPLSTFIRQPVHKSNGTVELSDKIIKG
jgi:hypothetical protein